MTRLLAVLARQRRALILALAALVGAGIVQAFRMPAAILPEVAFPRISVIADSGELPPDEMVRTVTKTLEDAVRRVPDLREVRSTTSRGSTEIHLDCDWKASMPRVLQLVQAQIDAVRTQLPDGTTVEARLMSPVLFPVVGFSLTSRTVSRAELRDVATLVLKPELTRLPGVADVVIQGGDALEARVTLDPAALEARGLDAKTVADAVRSAGTLESVGLLEVNGEQYLGLADARPVDLDSLRALPIPVEGGAPVALGSLGQVSLVPAPAFTRYRAGHGEAVLVNLLRKPSASTVALSEAAHAWFRAHRAQLPADLQIETFYDQSELIRAAVASVRDSLLAGAVMAIGIVLLFLRRVRLGLAAALVLPGAIALTLCGLAAFGHSLNLMTLGGVAAAVGLVLDDAIVVVEHMAHRASEHAATTGAAAAPNHGAAPPPDDREAGTEPEQRRRAAAEIVPTLAGSTLCTIAIFIPFAFLGGVAGAFFRVLATSMVLMLVCSFLLCVIVVPWFPVAGRRAHAAPVADHAEPRRPGRFARARTALERRPVVALGVAFALLAAVIPLRATLGSGFLPDMDEGSITMDYLAPPGFSAAETDRMLQQIERTLNGIPEIRAWSRRTGDQLGFFITEPNTGDYVLRLTQHRHRSADAISDSLRDTLGRVEPALDLEFGQLIEDVLGDLTTAPQPIEIRVLGADRALLQQKAQEIAKLIGTVPGVVDVRSGVVVSGPNLSVTPAPAGVRAGLTAEPLADAVMPYVQGIPAGQITRGAHAWPIRIVLPPPAGASPMALAGARVPLARGSWAPLGTVARLGVQAGETEIDRDDERTMVAATARLSGRDLGSAIADIQRRVAREIVLPYGTSVRYAGLYEEQQSSFRGLALVLAGAAAAVLLLLLVAFRSWRQAGAVLLVASASLAGVLAALHLGGATFNITSFVGAIMVVGIVAENAYFLVAAYHEALGRGLDSAGAAAAAASRRTRPVLMTTAAGIAALLPLALGIGSGSALLQPLAIAVIGGFAVSALLLLLVLPALLVTRGSARAASSA